VRSASAQLLLSFAEQEQEQAPRLTTFRETGVGARTIFDCASAEQVETLRSKVSSGVATFVERSSCSPKRYDTSDLELYY